MNRTSPLGAFAVVLVVLALGLGVLTVFLLFSGAAGGLAALALALACGAAGAWALRRLANRDPAPATDTVAPVQPNRVPPGPVWACMRCANPEMHPAPLAADILFNEWHCPRCGHRGQPLAFDDGKAWAAFAAGLAADREGAVRPPQTDEP